MLNTQGYYIMIVLVYMETPENIAEGLAKQYNSKGISPFPYENILKDHTEVEMFFIDTDDQISGAIMFEKITKKIKILINRSKSRTRQQFTIAHELGHYFLHSDTIRSEQGFVDGDGNLDSEKILYRLDEAKSTRIEVEANRFAASLIMPKDYIERAWNELRDVEECAKIFNVSVSAMSIRLEKLGLLP